MRETMRKHEDDDRRALNDAMYTIALLKVIIVLLLNNNKYGFMSSSPINDIQKDKKGNLWIVGGLSHTLRSGIIWKYDGNKWVLFSLVTNFEDKKPVNWSFEPTEFISLEFNDNNEMFLLTADFENSF